MCFSLVNLVLKGTRDMFVISVHLGTIVTVPSGTKIVVCVIVYICISFNNHLLLMLLTPVLLNSGTIA